MDDERFDLIYRLVMALSPARGKRCQYGDGIILLVLLWAAMRQKPISWACDPRNAPSALRGRPLPSPSRVSRRLRHPSVNTLLQLTIRHYQQQWLVAAALIGCWTIDAKGFAVSRFSKDRQARWGHCRGGKARGYKLFLLVDAMGLPVSWHVDSMNTSEPMVARRLIKTIERPGYVLGDAVYDSDQLYRLAVEKQLQLVAPRKQPHKPIGQRAQSEPRLHAIAMLETPGNRFGPTLYAERAGIERTFSRWSASTVGLDHLPGWVRGLDRVRRWINAKILIALALAAF